MTDNEKKNVSEEFNWVDRVYHRYEETERLIPERQERLYQKIRDEFVGGKLVVDVGCGVGLGANILSHEARFVWGLDVNPRNIDFAKKMFSRPNLDFTILDIENAPTREVAKFEIVTMIEVIEHLDFPQRGLDTFKRLMGNNAIGFITIPNQANPEVRDNEAKHGLHIQKWTAGEFYKLMTEQFNVVTMYSADKVENWDHGETVDGNSQDYLIVAKVEGAK